MSASCKFCQDDTVVIIIVCGRRKFSFVVSGRNDHLRLRSTCFEVRSLMGIMRKKCSRMRLVRQKGAYFETTDVSSLNLAHRTFLRYESPIQVSVKFLKYKVSITDIFRQLTN